MWQDKRAGLGRSYVDGMGDSTGGPKKIHVGAHKMGWILTVRRCGEKKYLKSMTWWVDGRTLYGMGVRGLHRRCSQKWMRVDGLHRD